ncbi:MAG: phosphoribosylanthranilate isomerase [Acidobacteriaceae bacterium]|nr:phosphoribosylanthranilate isomerase [Acidobacteriaceae bacterium]
MWVKICANTSLEDAQLAIEAGADAIGFVFAESVRRVTPTQVRAITPKLSRNVEKYGVFVDTGFEEIAGIVEECGLTGVQFHGVNSPALAANLREHLSKSQAGGLVRILQVIHYGGDLEQQLQRAQAASAIDGVLVDSRTATLFGGTGRKFDWEAASATFRSTASRLRMILAGGLNPDNVGEAIRTLRPWGVDVASGVEAAPGRKDPAKVKLFVENARITASTSIFEVAVES